MTTREDLHRAIFVVLDNGRRVPCVGDDRWLSTDNRDLVEAVKECRECPVLALCRSYSEEAGECAGVWGGKRRGHTGTFIAATRGLTPAEKLDVDALLAGGATSPAIAKQLGLTLNQVNNRRYKPSDKSWGGAR